jgi:S1-C subfamily serine protease
MAASDKSCKPIAFAAQAPQAGDPVIRINRSLTGAEFTEGNFAEMRSRDGMGLPDLENENKQRELMVLKMNHSLGHQFSGSPYLNRDGKVVGVHEAGIENEQSIATPIVIVEAGKNKSGR